MQHLQYRVVLVMNLDHYRNKLVIIVIVTFIVYRLSCFRFMHDSLGVNNAFVFYFICCLCVYLSVSCQICVLMYRGYFCKYVIYKLLNYINRIWGEDLSSLANHNKTCFVGGRTNECMTSIQSDGQWCPWYLFLIPPT